MKPQTFDEWFASQKPEFQAKMREQKLVWTLRRCFAAGRLSGALAGIEHCQKTLVQSVSGLRVSVNDIFTVNEKEE